MKRNGCRPHLGPSDDPFEVCGGFGDHQLVCITGPCAQWTAFSV